jgi:hypothetical protein
MGQSVLNSEVGMRKTEDGGQKTEVRGQMTDDRLQKSQGGCLGAEVGKIELKAAFMAV